MKTGTAVIITINGASYMTKSGRKRVSNWIRRQADFLEKEFKNLSKIYRARYLYRIPRQ